jgi:hypothetical protein
MCDKSATRGCVTRVQQEHVTRDYTRACVTRDYTRACVTRVQQEHPSIHSKPPLLYLQYVGVITVCRPPRVAYRVLQYIHTSPRGGVSFKQRCIYILWALGASIYSRPARAAVCFEQTAVPLCLISDRHGLVTWCLSPEVFFVTFKL